VTQVPYERAETFNPDLPRNRYSIIRAPPPDSARLGIL
jgi:hypothetical protein